MATKFENSWQVYPLLCHLAKNRQTMTYEELAKLTGGGDSGTFVGQNALDYIQAWCHINKLPPLTSLIVSAINGSTGAGSYVSFEDLPAAHAQVFKVWAKDKMPMPDDFSKVDVFKIVEEDECFSKIRDEKIGKWSPDYTAKEWLK